MTKKKWSNFSNFVQKVITKKRNKVKGKIKQNKRKKKNKRDLNPVCWNSIIQSSWWLSISPFKANKLPENKTHTKETIDARLWLLQVNPIDFIKYFCRSYMILAIDLQCVCLILYNRKTLSFVIILRVFVVAAALLTNPKFYDKFATKSEPFFAAKTNTTATTLVRSAYNSRLNGLNALKVFPKCKWSGTRPA